MSRKWIAAALIACLAVPGGAMAQSSNRPGLSRVTAPPPPATSRTSTSGTATSGGQSYGDPVAGSGPAYYDQATVDRSKRQTKGEFEPLERSGGSSVSLGTTQDAWTAPFRNMSPGQVAPGVVRFQWSPELVMPIRAREFMLTLIVLPEWEKIDQAVIGENYYFEARILRDNTLALRTGASGIDTSLTIMGSSGNSYDFYVRAETFNTKSLTDMKVFVDAAPPKGNGLAWFKGSNEMQTDRPAGAGGSALAIQAAASMPDIPPPPQAPAVSVTDAKGGTASGAPAVAGSKWYIPDSDVIIAHRMFEVHEGDREIAPKVVYTNGRWTFFSYGEKGPAVDRPVVYRLVDGVETRVNTRTIGDFNEVLVAEAVGDFVLRSGQKAICVIRASKAGSNSVKQ